MLALMEYTSGKENNNSRIINIMFNYDRFGDILEESVEMGE